MTKTIQLSQLVGACKDQFDIVRAEWPNGIPLTEEALRRAIQLRLDVDWAASRLLSTPALAEYERVRHSAWAEYERVCATCLLRLLMSETWLAKKMMESTST